MVWLENKGAGEKWEQHLVDEVDMMECGGSLYDLTGSGNLDIINGDDWRSDEGTGIHDALLVDMRNKGIIPRRNAALYGNQRDYSDLDSNCQRYFHKLYLHQYLNVNLSPYKHISLDLHMRRFANVLSYGNSILGI